jgi:hypothetical protein
MPRFDDLFNMVIRPQQKERQLPERATSQQPTTCQSDKAETEKGTLFMHDALVPSAEFALYRYQPPRYHDGPEQVRRKFIVVSEPW